MITFSSMSGTSGITQIIISATSNSELESLVENYTLSNGTKSLLLPIAQMAYVPTGKYISFKPSSFSFESSGGTGSLQVTSNDDWYINFGSWVYPNEVRGNGNTIVGIRVEANTGDTRSGSITGYCLSDSAQTASTSVSQVGSYVEPTLSVSPLKTAVNASGGVGYSLAVVSNQDWNVYTDARWITLNTSSGSGNGNISFEVLENSTDIEREANISVISTASSLSATSVIVQSAQTQETPYIVVSPSTYRMGTSGGSFTVTVSSNTEWETAVVYGSGNGWISLDKLNGEGDDTVVVKIDPDLQESVSGRSAYISFYNTKENLKAEVNISQYDVDFQVYDNEHNQITSSDVPCTIPNGNFRIENLDFVQEDVKIALFSHRPTDTSLEMTMNSDSSFTFVLMSGGVYVETVTLSSEDDTGSMWHKYISFDYYPNLGQRKSFHFDYYPSTNVFTIETLYYNSQGRPSDIEMTCEELY